MGWKPLLLGIVMLIFGGMLITNVAGPFIDINQPANTEIGNNVIDFINDGWFDDEVINFVNSTTDQSIGFPQRLFSNFFDNVRYGVGRIQDNRFVAIFENPVKSIFGESGQTYLTEKVKVFSYVPLEIQIPYLSIAFILIFYGFIKLLPFT